MLTHFMSLPDSTVNPEDLPVRARIAHAMIAPGVEVVIDPVRELG